MPNQVETCHFCDQIRVYCEDSDSGRNVNMVGMGKEKRVIWSVKPIKNCPQRLKEQKRLEEQEKQTQKSLALK